MTSKEEREELAHRIATILEIDGQYVTHADPDDSARIALIRSAGRAAGRILGWKVRTFQTDPEMRDDGKVVVLVAVVEASPEDTTRFEDRADLLIREAFKEM